jgi:glycosyltransferase involved in cell wall biosynthesis
MPVEQDPSPRRTSVIEFAEALGYAILRRPADLCADGPLTEVGGAAVLHYDPLVLYMPGGERRTLGMPGTGAALLKHTRTVFLMAIYGSIESHARVMRFRRAAILHRWRWPNHSFVFLCNTAKEESFLRETGEVAVFLNHNLLMSEKDFHPIEGEPLRFDAVYNGRLHPQKRHELSLLVDRCAMIFAHTFMESDVYQKELILRHTREAPGHLFVNELQNGVPVQLEPSAINRIYNQSAVGLALSKVEGAMYASIEYLLSGLPVVSTPNRGGRDVYFDDDFCITVAPDPRAVRDAVAALKNRAIPRHHIRARTLEKIERDRVRFSALLQSLIERNGGIPDHAGGWPFRSKLVTWKSWNEHFADIRARRLTGLDDAT